SSSPAASRALPSFPPRRSSDLAEAQVGALLGAEATRQPFTRNGNELVGVGRQCPNAHLAIGAEAQQPLAVGMECRREHEVAVARSEEHTSELQSRENLVCRLLL